jgi:hypothetical protein
MEHFPFELKQQSQPKFLNYVGFEVLMAVSTKMAVFWVVAIALMMEAARTSETLVNFYQTTWRYNPEDSHLLSKLQMQILNRLKLKLI